ncbi:lysosomal protective protein-like [Littorina saxatilis]|uniref:Carboxypeptidase n=1 Tax=Littorina saxatilis TaxID=31220 RepID=A0AAN9BIR9_9CAEN
MMHVLLILLLLPAAVMAAPSEDEIQMLPGLTTQPSFKQYSGYLAASDTKKLHYWFAESMGNPKTDPVALWMNGGPGCSSIMGLLSENGPFKVKEDGRSLEYNPFSWNTVANVIFLESPAGIGYSYATDKNYTTNDDLTAQEHYWAMKDFFLKFPEYRSNLLYITGESYGGIYVPQLVILLASDSGFNLAGYAIGNGFSRADFLLDSLVYFAYYHGLVGTTEWKKLLNECCGGSQDDCKFYDTALRSPACNTEVEKVQTIQTGGYFDMYNLYSPCATGAKSYSDKPSLPKHGKAGLFGIGRDNPDNVCQNNTATQTYLNLPAVRQALHIPHFVQKWQVCLEYQDGWYTKQYNDTSFFYYDHIFKAGIPGILYVGDVDMACNFLGNEWFADSLGRPVKEERKMWYYRDEKGLRQVAGFVKTFDLLTYVTLRGAGHLSPMDRPRSALVMFTNLVQNRPFQ